MAGTKRMIFKSFFCLRTPNTSVLRMFLEIKGWKLEINIVFIMIFRTNADSFASFFPS